jgi:hypothetical protein
MARQIPYCAPVGMNHPFAVALCIAHDDDGTAEARSTRSTPVH